MGLLNLERVQEKKTIRRQEGPIQPMSNLVSIGKESEMHGDSVSEVGSFVTVGTNFSDGERTGSSCGVAPLQRHGKDVVFFPEHDFSAGALTGAAAKNPILKNSGQIRCLSIPDPWCC
jgi:hypothetical protein